MLKQNKLVNKINRKVFRHCSRGLPCEMPLLLLIVLPIIKMFIKNINFLIFLFNKENMSEKEIRKYKVEFCRKIIIEKYFTL